MKFKVGRLDSIAYTEHPYIPLLIQYTPVRHEHLAVLPD